MNDASNREWIESRLRDRAANRRKNRIASRRPDLLAVDAGTFSQQIAALAHTLTLKLRDEGGSAFGNHFIQEDIHATLLQLRETYSLLQFLNSDDTRDGNSASRLTYTFVSLPLVRTMIDGFYNCTALMKNPATVKQFRVSGLFRMREAIEEQEARYGSLPGWGSYLEDKKDQLAMRMRVHGFTNADLDDKKNKWPLMGEYIRSKPETPHKKLLGTLTHGFWKEYSSISHVSFDGLLSIMPFLRYETYSPDKKRAVQGMADQGVYLHFGRAAGVLLCLLTEIQWFSRFPGSSINLRLQELWTAMMPVVEVAELYDLHYKSLLEILKG